MNVGDVFGGEERHKVALCEALFTPCALLKYFRLETLLRVASSSLDPSSRLSNGASCGYMSVSLIRAEAEWCNAVRPFRRLAIEDLRCAKEAS